MRTHKRQHFVPQAYLKAWCDPTTPAGQEPYVWRFGKDGSESRPKAPEKIFRETEHQGAGGDRDAGTEAWDRDAGRRLIRAGVQLRGREPHGRAADADYAQAADHGHPSLYPQAIGRTLPYCIPHAHRGCARHE